MICQTSAKPAQNHLMNYFIFCKMLALQNMMSGCYIPTALSVFCQYCWLMQNEYVFYDLSTISVYQSMKRERVSMEHEFHIKTHTRKKDKIGRKKPILCKSSSLGLLKHETSHDKRFVFCYIHTLHTTRRRRV
jgi:hypothetical protein